MAKKSGGGEPGQNSVSLKQNAKMGDIYTAAKSTMEAADYWQGYPANEGELLNQNFSGKKGKKG